MISAQSLITTAKLRSVASDFQKHSTAVTLFKAQYDALPGDMPNATSYWSSLTNGNGNRLISYSMVAPDEHYYAWQHLANGAQLLPGSYNATGTALPGVNNPAGAISNSFFGFCSDSSTPQFGVYNTNAIVLTSPYSLAAYCTFCGESLRPKEAAVVDAKIDDGIANTGQLYSIDGGVVSSGACSAAYSVNAGANYNLATNYPACRVYYWLEKTRR